MMSEPREAINFLCCLRLHTLCSRTNTKSSNTLSEGKDPSLTPLSLTLNYNNVLLNVSGAEIFQAQKVAGVGSAPEGNTAGCAFARCCSTACQPPSVVPVWQIIFDI